MSDIVKLEPIRWEPGDFKATLDWCRRWIFDGFQLPSAVVRDGGSWGQSPIAAAYHSVRLHEALEGYIQEMLHRRAEAMVRQSLEVMARQIIEAELERLAARKWLGQITAWHRRRPGWWFADLVGVGRN